MTSDTGPLAGYTVLDLGQAAVAPIAASYLGMLGATVIKVEPPGGDMVRVGEPNMRGTSTTFIGNNWNKLGTWLNLKTEQGCRDLSDLIARADLLIENFRSPQVLERLGFDYQATMSTLNPRLVYVESSAFGENGPLTDMVSNEWITEAAGGMVSVTGSPGRPEFMRGTSLLDWSGAMVNTVACLAGLLQQAATGQGIALRTSQLGSTIFAGLTRVVECLATGVPGRPQGSDGQAFAPDGAFATQDGFVGLCAPSERTWRSLCSALKVPELADHKNFTDNAARVRHREQLTSELERTLRERPTAEWLPVLADAVVPHCAFPTERWLSDELAGNPQVIFTQGLYALPTPWGLVKTQAPHWRFSETPARINRPSPVFGQHLEEVFGSGAPVGGTAPKTQTVLPSASGSFVRDDVRGLQPLRGIRVLEVAQGVCGPLAGRVLGELGADVTKISGPGPDWLLGAAPQGETTDRLYQAVNAGKTFQELNLKDPANRSQLEQELRAADVVIGAYTSRQLKALGVDYDDVAAVNPAAVYCQITGWGAGGPDAERPATELDVQSAAGMFRHLGSKGERPVRVGYDLVSINTALAAVQAVLAALIVRQRSGKAQKTEVSMLATAIAISQWGIAAESGPDRPRGLQIEGYDLPPDPGVRCGDGRACRLDFRKDYRNWYRLFDRLGVPELRNDPRFSTEDAIARHRTEIASVLTGHLSGWTFEQLDAFTRELGGTVVPVLDIDEVIHHPQVSGLRIIDSGSPAAVRFPYLASYWTAANPGQDAKASEEAH